MDDRKKFRDLYIQTAQEHITAIKNLFDDVLTSTEQVAVITELHRHFHSLKGESFVMNYQHFGMYVTVLEKYFKALMEEKSSFPGEKAGVIKDAIQTMSQTFQSLKESDNEPESLDEMTSELKKVLGVEIT